MTEVALLDTHVLLWWSAGGQQLSTAAAQALSSSRLLVSPISFWETAMLVAKGRIALDRPTAMWANDVLALDQVSEAHLHAGIAVRAGELAGFHGDPADRILAATAIDAGCVLITRDGKLSEWSRQSRELVCLW